MKKSKIVRFALAVLSACLLMGALSACAQAPEGNDEASQNRQYLSLLNSQVGDLQTVMDDFGTAVSEQNIVAMKSQLDKAEKILGEIQDQDAPDALTDIQGQYVDALNALDQSMSSYVDLYERTLNGGASTSDVKSELGQIQESYDAAVEQLKDADDALRELAG